MQLTSTVKYVEVRREVLGLEWHLLRRAKYLEGPELSLA